MTQNLPAEHWLVRKATVNRLEGPFTRERVCELIEQHQLGMQDEVCPANGYWFYLHEVDEVLKQLGVQIKYQDPENDTTETALADRQDRTDPNLRAPTSSEPESEPVESDNSQVENTVMLSSRRQVVTQVPADADKESPTNPDYYKPQVFGDIERPNIWRGIAGLLMAFLFFLFGALMYLLTRPPR